MSDEKVFNPNDCGADLSHAAPTGALHASAAPQETALKESPDKSYRKNLLGAYRKLSNPKLPEWTEGLLPLASGEDEPETLEQLRLRPRLQAALAAVTNYTPSKWLLDCELKQFTYAPRHPIYVGGPPKEPRTDDDRDPSDVDVYERADRAELAGLSFSGGGIRSATFCLGILQAFASAPQSPGIQVSLLERFDYLSTVSGGSYIHQWFAQWIANAQGRLGEVQPQLIPQPDEGSPARAPDPISWLRRYSSYLTPQRGFFSGDTWTMLAIWFRNSFLNQIVLFGFLASCLFVVRLLAWPFNGHAAAFVRNTCLAKSPRYVVGVVVVVVAIFVIVKWLAPPLERALRSQGAKVTAGRYPQGALTNRQVLIKLVAPGFAFAVVAGLANAGNLVVRSGPPWVLYVWALYVLCLLVVITRGRLDPPSNTSPPVSEDTMGIGLRILMSISILVFTGLIVYLAGGIPTPLAGNLAAPPTSRSLQHVATSSANWISRHHAAPSVVQVGPTGCCKMQCPQAAAHVPTSAPCEIQSKPAPKTADPHRVQDLLAIFAPLYFFALQFLAIRLQVGVVGRDLTEPRREWLARYGALSAMVASGWLVLTAIARLGPVAVRWIAEASFWKTSIVSLLAILIHVVTLYAGGSSKTDGKPDPSRLLGYKPLDLVGIVGAPICILILLMLTASAVNWIIFRGPLAAFIGAMIVAFIFVWFFGWRIDVNEFSMHPFYRNRLARCYLGASNATRTPDPFTGFDDHKEADTRTGLTVSDLLPARFGGPLCPTGKPVYDGPFPIFCSTLNLTFGEDLAWQERKGASFAFTPLYSGYDIAWTANTGEDPDTTYNAYVPTREYAYPKGGVRLAEATAISGAALSPNSGFNTQPALAFLMTLFNVRLSWWIANPRKPAVWPSRKNAASPLFGLWYLLSELFGVADDTSRYVCLADGGCFENMGMYELVRRRCKLIVVCDGEQDQDYVFEGIGKAIGKCRTDFGVEIQLDLSKVTPDQSGPNSGFAAEHVVCGTIHYPSYPGSKQPCLGKIVYIKAALTREGATADMVHYKRTNPAFPQESTLNQWFTESAFESYRRLGQLSGEAAAQKIQSLM